MYERPTRKSRAWSDRIRMHRMHRMRTHVRGKPVHAERDFALASSMNVRRGRFAPGRIASGCIGCIGCAHTSGETRARGARFRTGVMYERPTRQQLSCLWGYSSRDFALASCMNVRCGSSCHVSGDTRPPPHLVLPPSKTGVRKQNELTDGSCFLRRFAFF
jgi:hypothetical protein